MPPLTNPKPPFKQRYAESPSKCADELGISSATFYRRVMPYVYDGTIRSFKLGGCRRIIVSSLLAFLDTQEEM